MRKKKKRRRRKKKREEITIQNDGIVLVNGSLCGSRGGKGDLRLASGLAITVIEDLALFHVSHLLKQLLETQNKSGTKDTQKKKRTDIQIRLVNSEGQVGQPHNGGCGSRNLCLEQKRIIVQRDLQEPLPQPFIPNPSCQILHLSILRTRRNPQKVTSPAQNVVGFFQITIEPKSILRNEISGTCWELSLSEKGTT